MRIAFYAPLKPPDHPVASGDRNMARALMAALELAGHEVAIASRFRSFDQGNAARQARIRDIGAKIANRLLRHYEAEGRRPHLWFTYHLYHKAPDWLGPTVAGHFSIPYVVAEASFAPKQEDGKWALGHRAAAAALRHADRVFQLNPADAEYVLPLLASAERLVKLPPFLDAAPYRAPGRAAGRAALAEKFDLDPARPWLLTVAMMRSDQKLLSYRLLARALTDLADRDWRLVIAGIGPAESEVRAAFAPLDERIRWVGMLDSATLRALYRASDLYVWPAIKEAWGMALLEAQAAGLPVVAGRSGGIPAIVADGESGLLAAESDAAAFAEAVRHLLDRPELRERMGRAAERRVARNHDIAGAAAQLDRHLRALAR